MMTVSLSFELTLLYLVAAVVVVLLSYVLVLRRRNRIARAHMESIATAVKAFFQAKGDTVSVQVAGPPGLPGYVLLLQSESSKRFRHSHIVELVLFDHVRAVCNLELHKVYWRFPIKGAQGAAPPPGPDGPGSGAPAARPADKVDAYLSEGLSRLNTLSGYEVSEAPLEAFREVTQAKPGRE